MSDRLWVLRTYEWKGEAYFAVYRGRRQLGVLHGEPALAHELALALGGKVIELGEVRETPTIQVKQWTSYEPFEVIGGVAADYPSTFSEVQAAEG
jgi:hypothetical protein